jgi:hypothetical protein
VSRRVKATFEELQHAPGERDAATRIIPQDNDFVRGQFALSRFLAAQTEQQDHQPSQQPPGVVNAHEEDIDLDREDDLEVIGRIASEKDRYRQILTESPTYQWLKQSIKSVAGLRPDVQNVLNAIRTQILHSLSQRHSISRHSKPTAYTLDLLVDWEPGSFIREQKYTEEAPIVLRRAITLTGSGKHSQILTTEQYMAQVWPTTGEEILGFLCQLVVPIPDQSASKCKMMRTEILSMTLID